MSDKHYILEFCQVGNAIKVSAIDPVTMKEVSIVGSTTQSREELKRVAVQKLEYMLGKLDN